MNDLQELTVVDSVAQHFEAEVVGTTEDAVEILLTDHYEGNMVAVVVEDPATAGN